VEQAQRFHAGQCFGGTAALVPPYHDFIEQSVIFNRKMQTAEAAIALCSYFKADRRNTLKKQVKKGTELLF